MPLPQGITPHASVKQNSLNNILTNYSIAATVVIGCYPLTSAIDSTAATVADVIRETMASRYSERRGRLIDHDGAARWNAKNASYF